jgi:hypothetical protein
LDSSRFSQKEDECATDHTLALGLGAPAFAQPFFFTTGNPDGRIGVASRPESADGSKIEIEAADDFILNQPTLLYGAVFTGLMPPTSNSRTSAR